MKKTLRLLLLAAGLGLFGWFIQRAGWDNIRGTFEALGWLGLVALIPSTVAFSIYTLDWRFTFGPKALASLVTWQGMRTELENSSCPPPEKWRDSRSLN